MKNKGFTLIELLGVLIILAVIFVLVFPSVKDIVDTSKDTTNQKQINNILNAAYDWTLKNTNYLPDKDSKVFITLGELKMNGLVDSNIIDISTSELYSDDLVVSISNVGPNYKDKNKYTKLNGNYLYKLEVDLMSSDEYESKKPTIILSGLTANSTGDYVSTIDINTEFKDVNYIATSFDGADLTDKVIINILYGDKLVEKIYTNTAGIYHINYTVIDELGYATTVTRNVIVTDNLGPELTIPEFTNITSDILEYDLMKDVTCSDNSGKCDITYMGEIKFGTLGKYIIEYTAKDPSGNTTVQKRVITIE